MTATQDERTHQMAIAEPSGAVKYSWNGVVEEQQAVAAIFAAKMKTGMYMAYQVATDPTTGAKINTQIDTFDEEAELIMLVPALAGGC